ncbi:hypothetical protein VNO80_11776 [Phaseolus coccineus]|uniref:Uncharacterized protein n=1 Tax=Phaseolus coccineus TaxID=3886 RepID=A0AAN9NFW4_PHACN
MNLLLVFMFRGKQDSNVVTLKQVYKTAEFFAFRRVGCISEITFPRFFLGVYLSFIACNYHSVPCFVYWFSSGVIAKFVMLGGKGAGEDANLLAAMCRTKSEDLNCLHTQSLVKHKKRIPIPKI